MYWISNKLIWIPLYAFLVFLLIKKYKQKSAWILIFVAILITCSDQISVLIKNWIERPRPCHNNEISHLIHLVNNHCGGTYGFVSSHASNTFALAIFLSVFFKKNIWYFAPLAFFWAALVSYSRVYLGVHYPGDVLAGAMLGAGLGFVFAFLCQKVLINLARKKPEKK
jgi:undecaprenyl-diphosphatase